ncbi:MAG TPA: NAD(P)H-quinone oxidoreductase [Myxococcales bacterium]|nr:NAD(P)H-quinone oxidoreductase [Myxococcales bacterium]
MRAVIVREPGGVEVLEQREVADPEPRDGELLVRVKAAGVNRADVLQRRGRYPAPADAPQDILGLEFAGEVEACGRAVSRFRPGDRVMGVVGGGACAERLVIHERIALPVPRGLGFAEAAAIPEAFLTAFDAALLQGALEPGNWLLVHAVGSGVGTAAVQLARLVNARTVGTARSEAKIARARGLGLAVGLVLDKPLFADEVKRRTGGPGADVVLDLVGGAYLEENLRAMAPLGRQIVVGLVAGSSVSLSLGLLLAKRLTLRGTVLRSRSLEERAALALEFERQILPQFEQGALRPIVDRVLPMAEIAEAHRLIEANASFGKLVLSW